MRLVRRDSTGNIHFTKDLSETDLPPYAILSHTWTKDEEEVTFEDILNDTGSGKPGYDKIRFGIQQSQKDDLQYFWIDTCCIDKRNLVELDRSLRSMYRWYRNAEKCYVLLSDVDTDIRHSRWFTRGWTLQELIAPKNVEFFSKDWTSIGTKITLEKDISNITDIPIPALRGDLQRYSMIERRGWQEHRQTREPEDLVYSLLGLLDISMPVLYGEGEARARQRLDVEIMNAGKGIRHNDFSLTFSLAAAAVETQHFIARQDELLEIRQHLKGEDRRIVILHGLGGIGKTQLAMAYAKKHRDDYSAVLWLNAKDDTTARSSFAQMAKQISREHDLSITDNQDATIDMVKSWLSMPFNTCWLLICDNYDNPHVPGNDTGALDLRKYLPETHQGSVLVTTRSSQVKLGHCVRLTKFNSVEDSLALLAHSSGRNLLSDSSALNLAYKLDGLPLALATAGAYLSQSTMTVDEYLHYFEQSWAKLQKSSPTLTTYEDRTLYSTWQISYEQIEQQNVASAGLLRLWAFFDNQDLWYELLQHVTDQVPGMQELVKQCKWIQQLRDRLDFEECMRVICNHGLAGLNPENVFGIESRGYSVHSCVHTWMLATQDADDHTLARIAIWCVVLHLPPENAMSTPLFGRRLLKHADRCLTADDLTGTYWSSAICFNLGILYSRIGRLEQAQLLYEQALEKEEQQLGPEHPWTLQTLHSLASVHLKADNLTQAEGLYERALKSRRIVLGETHKETLETIGTLAHLYLQQGKLSEAETMYMQALKGLEESLGPKHITTIQAFTMVGALYCDQGKLDQAGKVWMRALEESEQVHGAEAISTLQAVNNLGSLYVEQDKLSEAEQMYKRALKGYEVMLGTQDLAVFEVIENLGNVYAFQGKPIDAEESFVKALAGKEKILGVRHTSTLMAVNNLGLLYARQGRLVEANELYCRVKADYDKMRPRDQGKVDVLKGLCAEQYITVASQQPHTGSQARDSSSQSSNEKSSNGWWKWLVG